jgi:hypothetical protein
MKKELESARALMWAYIKSNNKVNRRDGATKPSSSLTALASAWKSPTS